MILKKVKYPRMNEADWEEVPQEDLWEDGELNEHQVGTKILYHVMKESDWKLIREKS